MAVSVKHRFVSPVADAGNPEELGPNEWNDTHDVTGLENIDNTSDADKPISTATQTALDLKADEADVSNVDNTSDADKPVSTAQQTALDLKANIASPTLTGTPAAPTAAADTSTTQLATTAYVVGQAATATPLSDGTAAVGTSLKYAREDHKHPSDTSKITTIDTISNLASLPLAEADLFFVTEDKSQVFWLPTSDDISTQITAGDPRYIALASDTTGASGGFFQNGSIPTGSRFSNDSPPVRIKRWADRFMVGDAVVYNGVDAGSWVWDIKSGATAGHGYFEQSAKFASVTSTGTAISGAARALTGTGTAFGGIFYAQSEADGLSTDGAFGLYVEGARGNALASSYGIELDITNLVVSPNGQQPFTPWGPLGNPGGAGSTLGLWLASGGDPTINPTTFDADAGIVLVNNGAKFLTGVVFQDNALFRDAGGYARAIVHSVGHMHDWYEADTETVAFKFGSVMTTATLAQKLLANDSGLVHLNAADKTVFKSTLVASAVNGTEITSAATGNPVSIAAVGDDTDIDNYFLAKGSGAVFLKSGNGVGFAANAVASATDYFLATGGNSSNALLLSAAGASTDINMILRAKGAGGVFFEDGSSNIKIWANATGIGFFGGSPTAKPTVSGAKGSNAALGSLLTALSGLGLLTDSSTT